MEGVFRGPFPKEKALPEADDDDVCYLEIEDHVLGAGICNQLTAGIISYVLYNRDQIPLPFDDLRKTCAPAADNGEENSRTAIQMRRQRSKMATTASLLEELFLHLAEAFAGAKRTRIRSVAVVLGATVLNPKEVHRIDLPDDLWTRKSGPLSDVAAGRHHLSQAFHTLMARDKAKSALAPTGVSVLLLMRHDCGLNWFLPRPPLRLPTHCPTRVYRVAPAPSLWLQATSEKSFKTPKRGLTFQVYECPLTSLPPKDNNRSNHTESMVEVSDRVVDLNAFPADGSTPDDFIWFQMPVKIKGLALVH